MSRLRQVAVALVVVALAAQVIRPDRTNPAIDQSHTIRAQLGATSGLPPILDRSCGDCHSNATVWPWYTQVAPLSWLMAYGVKAGRKVVNFSEWSAYSPERQRQLLAASCQATTAGKMPGEYTWLHPEMKLSSQDIETICNASRGGS
jgi:hypothetical protein